MAQQDIYAYLESLNPHQLSAVNIGSGLSCVLGNPGSGKTRTIIGRIARLVADGFDPDFILAMTFTRAAANQMTERLAALGIQGCRVGTIHSLSRQIVATETDLFSHGHFDDKGRLLLELKKIITGMRRSGQLRDYDVDLEGVVRFIEACKASGLCYVHTDPFGLNIRAEAAIKKRAAKWWAKAGMEPEHLLSVYLALERSRGTAGLYDFDDMQLWAWLTLLGNVEARQRWRKRWAVVIIDEAQDSTPVQWDLARFLVGMESCIPDVTSLPEPPARDDMHHSLMAAGQPEQCLDLSTPINVMDDSGSWQQVAIRDVQAGMHVGACVKGVMQPALVLNAKTVIRKYHATVNLPDEQSITGTVDHLLFATVPDVSRAFYSALVRIDGEKWKLAVIEPGQPFTPILPAGESIRDVWLLNAYATRSQAQFEIEQYEGAVLESILIAGGINIRRPLLRTVSGALQEIVIKVCIGGFNERQHESSVSVVSPLLTGEIAESIKDVVQVRSSLSRGSVVGRVLEYLESGAGAYSIALKLVRRLSVRLEDYRIRVETMLDGAEGCRAIPMGHLVPAMLVYTAGEGPSRLRPVVKLTRFSGNKAMRDLEISMATNFFAAGVASHNSIYAWRAADPKIFVEYAKDSGVQTISLPLNYRSNKTICDFGSALIAGKPWALTGHIIPAIESVPPQDAVCINVYKTAEEEAEDIVNQCLTRAADGSGLRSCVVLSRLRVALDLAEVACIAKRIKYIKMASGSIFDSREVKDILGYLRVAAGLDPEGKWLYHIINRPFRYISKMFLTQCSSDANAMNISLLDAIKHNERELNHKQRRSIRDLYALLVKLNEMACEIARSRAAGLGAASMSETDAKAITPADMVLCVLKDTDYVAELRREEGLLSMDESKIAMLAFLARMADMFRDVGEFLEYIDRLAVAVKQAAKSGLKVGEDSRADALILSTVHRFKGLQADHIFLMDVVQGHLPCAKSDNPDEELRLAYVAVTRAKHTCTLSYSVQNSIADVDNLDRVAQNPDRLKAYESSIITQTRSFLKTMPRSQTSNCGK